MRYPPEHLLQLLQHHLKKPHQINQIQTLLITNGYLLYKPNSKSSTLKWMSTLLYNTLIRAHLNFLFLKGKQGLAHLNFNDPHKPITLFTHMLAHQATPNSHTFPSLIKAISSSPPLATLLSRPLHGQVIKRGLSLDRFIHTSFVSLFAQLGRLDDARRVFEEMPEPCLVSCNSMLDAFGRNGEVELAVELFEGMGERDVVSWTSVVNGFGRNRCYEEAVRFFGRMVREESGRGAVRPNEATLVSVLSSCANLEGVGALYQGKQIHCYIIKNDVELTVFLGTALIAMYGKTGVLRNAVQIFYAMKFKVACTWNAMISSLSSNGCEREALLMFDKMRDGGIQPNEVTFVTVLTSCARGKFVELGLRLFQSMLPDFNAVPRMEHYGCVVDMFGRAGLLEEAAEFIDRMPFEPDATVLGALLGACKVHGAVEMAGDVGKRLLELQPRHCGRYVVLSNIYAETGRWGKAADLRKTMHEKGIKKIPGCSAVGLT